MFLTFFQLLVFAGCLLAVYQFAVSTFPVYWWVACLVFAIPTAIIVMRSVSFLSKVWYYKKLKLDRLQLRYSPKRSATWSLDYFIRNCRDEMEKLEELFGYSLKGKVTIYLFPNGVR